MESIERTIKVSMLLTEDETEEEAEEMIYQALKEGLVYNREYEGKTGIDFWFE